MLQYIGKWICQAVKWYYHIFYVGLTDTHIHTNLNTYSSIEKIIREIKHTLMY